MLKKIITLLLTLLLSIESSALAPPMARDSGLFFDPDFPTRTFNEITANKIKKAPGKYDFAEPHKDFFDKFGSDLEKISQWLFENTLQEIDASGNEPGDFAISQGNWENVYRWHNSIYWLDISEKDIERAIRTLKEKLNFNQEEIFVLIESFGRGITEEEGIKELINAYQLISQNIEFSDLQENKNNIRSVFDDLLLAFSILKHGGPLNIQGDFHDIKHDHVNPLMTLMKNKIDSIDILNQIIKKLGRQNIPDTYISESLSDIQIMFLYLLKKFKSKHYYFTNYKCEYIEKFKSPDIKDWILETKQEYITLLKEYEEILKDLEQFIRSEPFTSHMSDQEQEHIDGICLFTKHYIGIVRTLRAFLSDEIPESLRENVKWIRNLNTWLLNQKFRSKGKEYSIYVKLTDIIIPLHIHNGLLHLAIERLISNGYHAIAKHEEELILGKIVSIQTKIRSDSKNKKFAQIILTNPGLLTDEQLDKDAETGLPKIFVINHDKIDRVSGLKFAIRAIQKMGGTVSVANKRQHDQDIVEFVVEFPLEHPSAKEITESTVYHAARMIAESK